MFLKNRPKIGLALGVGGSKGLAHIGVIKTLVENNIPIDFIAGSSIGALIGGFYAAKKDIYEIEKIALETNWPKIFLMFFEPSLKGILGGDKVEKFICDFVGNITFKDLKIPFAAVATDLSNAKSVALKSGELGKAIRASISIPVFFKPISIDNKLYADGGLSMPVPVKAVKEMGADIVIAVNLKENYLGLSHEDKFGLGKITHKSIDILTRYLSDENIKNADIVISPKVGHVGIFNKFLTTAGTKEVILIGETTTKESLERIKKLIEKKKPQKVVDLIKLSIERIKKIFQ